MTKQLKIVPLGGLGEIGRNCLVFEYDDDIIVVDAGLMFPSEEMLGVDLVIPDFTYLVERADKVRGIVITHGHEDHVGGLPYLLKDVRAPVYATPLTAGIIRTKLRSRDLRNSVELHTIQPGDTLKLGVFSVSPFHVTHSIPDAVGYSIQSPVGLIVHTGDFKIDHTPLDGTPTDLGELARLSREGVRLLLSDSTNIESKGYTASESRLRDTFYQVFSRAEGRIIVTTFASLLSRIQLVIESAARFGRKVAVAGRSMEDYLSIAENLGYVAFPPNTRVPLHQISSLDDHEVCVLATGSQGEPTAALSRMATGTFRHVNVREGDTVLISAKAIPGNETQIHRNVDALFTQGANVIYGERAGIHVSGHAAQEELKLILNLMRPQHFVPVHGAPRMLYQHARQARELGIPQDNITVLGNGLPLLLTERSATLGEAMPLETIYVDGSLVGDVGSTILRDRTALSQDGFVVAKVSVNGASGELAAPPEIVTQGFVYLPLASDLIETAAKAIADAASNDREQSPIDTDELSERIKRRLERLFYQETRRRPVVVPLVTVI